MRTSSQFEGGLDNYQRELKIARNLGLLVTSTLKVYNPNSVEGKVLTFLQAAGKATLYFASQLIAKYKIKFGAIYCISSQLLHTKLLWPWGLEQHKFIISPRSRFSAKGFSGWNQDISWPAFPSETLGRLPWSFTLLAESTSLQL